ncbi:MAG: hypothetical protein ACI9CA_000037 [Natronomonas sp.]|jgi:hypothetical protein
MSETNADTTGSTDNDRQAESALARLTDAVAELEEAAAEVEEADVEDAASAALIEAESALKDAESVAEDTRKDTVETPLEARVESGDALEAGNLRATRVESHQKYLYDAQATAQALAEADDEAAALATLAPEGWMVVPEEAASVSESDAVDLLADIEGVDPEEHIGRSAYSYFRVTRQD